MNSTHADHMSSPEPIADSLCLVSYLTPHDADARVGIRINDRVYDIKSLLGEHQEVPAGRLRMLDVMAQWGRIGAEVLEKGHRVEVGALNAPAVEEFELSYPVVPPARDAFALAGNYRSHVAQSAAKVDYPLLDRKAPIFFMKPTRSFSGPRADIEIDGGYTSSVDYELELGVVIGREGRDIAQDSAWEYVFGYLVVNDISARDIQTAGQQMDYLKAKGQDTFMPMGPGIVPRELVPNDGDLHLRLSVNGVVRQDASTSDMIRSVPEILAELSRGLTLLPGDIVATGTPSGTAFEMDQPAFLKEGDVVHSVIDTLGTLINVVRER